MNDRQNTRSNFGANGVYTYDNNATNGGQSGAQYGNSFASFLIGKPASFAMRSAYDTALLGSNYSPWAQDDFKVSRRLTLNLGMRWELDKPWTNRFGWSANYIAGRQSALVPNAPAGLVYYGDKGVPKGLYPFRLDHFSPRAGFAYDVFGDGKTAIRGGYALLSRGTSGITIQHAYENPPFQRVLTINAPASPENPYAGVFTSDPFPYKPAATGAVFAYPTAVFSVDPRFTDGYTQQFNLNIQRQVGADIVIQAGYVGKLGRHLPLAHEADAPVFGPGSTAANEQQRRPIYPQYYASIVDVTSDGNSSYNSLQVDVLKRFSRGFTFNVAYTWSKSIDTGSADNAEGSTVSNPDHYVGGERGLAGFGRRQVLEASVSGQAPFCTNGWINGGLGGWRVAGIFTAVSGAPFSVITGSDTALLGTSRGLGNQRANLVGDAHYFSDPTAYFNAAAFAPPNLGAFGNLGRNALIGPGTWNLDTSLQKEFTISERIGRVELRLESFDTLNHGNLSGVQNSLIANQFGRATGRSGNRMSQVSLRYRF